MTEQRNSTILLIDSEPLMQELFQKTLGKAEFQVYCASTGLQGLEMFYRERPNLILLNVHLPDLDGWQTCQRIRKSSDVPIIFLTCISERQSLIRGLRLGAADYIVTPISHKLLVARIRTALRVARPTMPPEARQNIRDKVDFDQTTQQFLIRNKIVKLSKTESRFLTYLMAHAGQTLTHQEILYNIWGDRHRHHITYVHTYIWRLRNKLERDHRNPNILLSEHGNGYRFNEECMAHMDA